MRITGGELNLAEDVFKLQHLLDCNILKCREEVEDLTNAAVKEEQIETKLAAVQVRRGPQHNFNCNLKATLVSFTYL